MSEKSNTAPSPGATSTPAPAAPELFTVQVAARVAPKTNYYRSAGLCLTKDQVQHKVTAHQLAVLRADARVVVVGGPETLPSLKPAPKPADPKDLALQQLGAAATTAAERAKSLEDENAQLKARLSNLEQKVGAKK